MWARTLEGRRLLAGTTLSIPVPAALDGEARMGDVIDTPDGFGPNWLFDAERQTFFAGTPEQLMFNDSRGMMEFPIGQVPAGARIDSAVLKFHVQDFRVGFEGVLPSVDFDGYAGDGRLQVQDAFNFEPLPSPRRIGSADTFERRAYSVPLDKAFVQSLVGRTSHLGIVAGSGAGTSIFSAEGAAAAKVTPPTLVLTFTPPATPLPPPTPFPSGSIAGGIFIDADADGVRDAGEIATAIFKAFVDLNKSGVMDGAEGGANTDDAGNYRITGLSARTYRVVVVVPTNLPGWRQTPRPQKVQVAITLAEFRPAKHELRVEATSTLQTARLDLFDTATGKLIGTSTNEGDGRCRDRFTVAPGPRSVTVKSSLGGPASFATKWKS